METKKIITEVPNHSTRNVLIALGVGAVTGAALGILFAPDKGSITRSKITGKAKEAKHKIKNEVNHLADKLS
jgi:gas vesicle protein